MKVNCGTKKDCSCSHPVRKARKATDLHTARTHLAKTEVRHERYEDKAYMIVPVVMARVGVVMNGALTVEEELVPESWDGVPVTIGHPTNKDGSFLSAQSPETLTNWSVGRIFNSSLEDGALKGEAWIELDKANKLAPGLVSELKNGMQLDVSTGFFCMEEMTEGESEGRAYTSISRDIKPNHLALLPGEEGACNWNDGCGVRANKQEMLLMKLKDKVTGAVRAILNAAKVKETPALKKVINAEVAKAVKAKRANARNADDDPNQIVADLMANDASPFTTDDEGALKSMSLKTLEAMRAQYLGNDEEPVVVEEDDVPAEVENEGEEDDKEPVVEEDDKEPTVEADDEEEKPVAAKKNGKTLSVNADQLAAIVAKEVKKASNSLLSPADRAILARAHKSADADKATLVKRITANSGIAAATLKGMDLATLEGIAKGLHPRANYGGQALPDFDKDDAAAVGMVPPSAREFMVNARKGKQKGAH